MIIVKLMGGLGNQLFQYAFGQQLKKIYGEEVTYDTDWRKPIFEDFSSSASGQRVPMAIENLQIDPLTDWRDIIKDVSSLRKICLAEKQYHVLQKVIRVFTRNERIGERVFQYYARKGYYFNFDPFYYDISVSNEDVKVAYGYFQSERYFYGCREEIKLAFQPRYAPTDSEKKWIEKIEHTDAVAVHIRMGDYLEPKNKMLAICTPSYFRRGIQYLQERLSDLTFYVFSDDIEAVKQTYDLPPDAQYISGFKAYQDMRLMTHCKHFVLSNSTFAWWGAYLSGCETKQIVAPEKWNAYQKREPFDIYLPDMVKIPC